MTGHSIPETQEDTRSAPSIPSVGGQETGLPTNTMENTFKYAAADYQQLTRLRAANTPNQLRGRDRKPVCIFYNSFVDFNRIYRILLKILDDMRLDRLDEEDENVYPTGMRNKSHNYSTTIIVQLFMPDWRKMAYWWTLKIHSIEASWKCIIPVGMDMHF